MMNIRQNNYIRSSMRKRLDRCSLSSQQRITMIRKKNFKKCRRFWKKVHSMEKEQVSLRLPEITKYTDEKEVELTGLYGEPVESQKNM